ncbi:hypothetical protein P692DRAFT_20823711 [Suillus brevipes Sb2]|nr:hypothetical protein P692DRAFT_20823711 [Suillus brevipes Sb2]
MSRSNQRGQGGGVWANAPASTDTVKTCTIHWEGIRSARTERLLAWCKENDDARIKLFSDSAKDAKEQGRRKKQSGSLRDVVYSQVAHAVFSNDEDLESQLILAQSLIRCFRLRKKYNEFNKDLKQSGAGKTYAELQEDPKMKSLIDTKLEKFPWWPKLHGWWRTNPAFNLRKRALLSAADPPPPKKAAMCILSPLDTDEEEEGDKGVPSSPLPKKGLCTQTTMTRMKPNLGMEMPHRWFPKVNMQQISIPYSLAPLMGGSATCAIHIPWWHINVYKQWCEAGGITMHHRAIPPREDDIMTQSQSTLDSKLVCKPPAFTKEGLLEYIMELIMTEDEAIQLIDKPAFRHLLQYAHPTLTEKTFHITPS